MFAITDLLFLALVLDEAVESEQGDLGPEHVLLILLNITNTTRILDDSSAAPTHDAVASANNAIILD